jgi:type IV pilus modification protein PilV
MTAPAEKGFTIVEVLIAIVMLTIGILALSATSASVTRMMDSGRNRTVAASIAQSVLDSLRTDAFATDPQCTAIASGSLTTPPETGFTASWTVATAGLARNITVTVGYRAGPNTRSEIVTSSFYCRP